MKRRSLGLVLWVSVFAAALAGTPAAASVAAAERATRATVSPTSVWCPEGYICLFYGPNFSGPVLKVKPGDTWQASYPDLHRLPCVLPNGDECVSSTHPEYSNGRWSDQVSGYINRTLNIYCWWAKADYEGDTFVISRFTRKSFAGAGSNDRMRSVRTC